MSSLDLRFARARRHPFSGLPERVLRATDVLLAWRERARQRRHLQSLSDRMLRDIGLTRADVLAEASKPFWRL